MFEKDGVIFFDRIDLNGNLIQTAEEAYNAWANREQIDICPGPTVEEQLLATQKMVLSLQEQIIDML